MSARWRRVITNSFHAALAAASPESVRKHLPPPPNGTLFIVGAGKAAAGMAKIAEQHYRGVSIVGAVVAPHNTPPPPLLQTRLLFGAHPLPDAAASRAARVVMKTVRRARKHDLTLTLISGGGSSLMGAPIHGLPLAEMRRVVGQLLNAGADVRHINIVRRQLSAAAGGKLAQMCFSPMRALIMSDVVGDRPADIASGPCTADPTSAADALEVLRQYNISSAITAQILQNMKPPPPAAAFRHVKNIVVAGAKHALLAGENELRQNGVRTVVNLGERAGDSQNIARAHGQMLAKMADKPHPIAVISGGEARAKAGEGKGGRNTDFALRLWRIAPPETVIFAADTDGLDGSQNAAGAVFDGAARKRAATLGLSADEYLRRADSGGFFAEIGALLPQMHTGVNVSDYRVSLLA